MKKSNLLLIAFVFVSACSEQPVNDVVSRTVAIGDLHGDIGSARVAFRLAAAIAHLR